MEIKYCPKCHREACRIHKTEDGGARIEQNGKTLINLGSKSVVKGLSIKCQHGHKVKLDVEL